MEARLDIPGILSSQQGVPHRTSLAKQPIPEKACCRLPEERFCAASEHLANGRGHVENMELVIQPHQSLAKRSEYGVHYRAAVR